MSFQGWTDYCATVKKTNSSRANLLVHLANINNKILEVIPRASKHFFERAEPTDL